jgi:HD superfamily phosphohydrolase
LGVYEVMRQILSHFDRNGYGMPYVDQRLALVSGLLHDVGHAPFSHALESVLQTHHEDWSEAIIRNPDGDVHRALASIDPGFPDQVADVIAKRHANRLVVSLVSGQLDADRLDYLMRDSLFTGVDYGKFDLPRIVRIMVPRRDRLVVRKSGRYTVEAYLLARYFMYWQVYFHPVCRAAEVLLKRTLARAQYLVQNGAKALSPYPELDRLLRGQWSLEDYLAVDDHLILGAFSAWQHHDDAILADLSRRFLDRRLPKYRELGAEKPTEDTVQALRALVAEAGYDPDYYCTIDEIGTIYYDYYLGDQDEMQGEGLFLWDDSTDTLIEMSQISRAIRAMAYETNHRVRRVYVPEEVLTDSRLRVKLHQMTDPVKEWGELDIGMPWSEGKEI